MSNILPDDLATRTAIIKACRWMNSSGINQGTSGNISVRTGGAGEDMLITPSGVPYDDLAPEMIVRMSLSSEPVLDAPLKPSSEWRFHQTLLRNRTDMAAVVHAHPAYCSALAINRESIPACHYMIAAFGGHDVPLTKYHLFGSQALADDVVKAMRDRHGCLMSNHGSVVVGESLEKALWRMEELENLAKVYTLSRQIGTPVILDRDEMAAVVAAFANYGPVKAP